MQDAIDGDSYTYDLSAVAPRTGPELMHAELLDLKTRVDELADRFGRVMLQLSDIELRLALPLTAAEHAFARRLARLERYQELAAREHAQTEALQQRAVTSAEHSQ